MYEDIYEMIKTDTEFQTIIKRQQKLSFVFTSIILAMFFSLFFTVVYAPSFFTTSLFQGNTSSFGALITFGVILASFILASLCMKRSNRKLDVLLNRLEEDI